MSKTKEPEIETAIAANGHTPATMKQVVYTGQGGPEVLQVVETDIPEPEPGEVRVKVLAAGVAFADLMIRHGTYPYPPPVGTPLGYDIVGLVDKSGPGISSLARGQMVGALLAHHGGYTQYAIVPAEMVVPVPDGVDPAEAVCLILNYLTAYDMLHRLAKVKAGERLLIHSAAGGVGTAVLQLGKLAGLEMYGTASKGKLDLVAGLGATPIDYRRQDFAARLRELTPEGIEVVLDPIGGPILSRSYSLLRKGGRLITYGSLSLRSGGRLAYLPTLARFAWRKLIPDGKRIMFHTGLPQRAERNKAWYRETLARLFNWLAGGKLQPVVGKRLPLIKAAEAHTLLENGAVPGKIVLVRK
ncbi:MAG: medium chain dehydrogenase/reductase family protein [Anaerolineae bacterium]